MSLRNTLAVVALAGAANAQVGAMLAPRYDINFPATETARNPLNWLGANGPYSPGQNVYGVSNDVPEHCSVDMAWYVSRHGSRYPDTGAYAGWVDMQNRFDANNGFEASGSLEFLKGWKTPLTDPARQIANLSPTGNKEVFDMAYQLRTRYPQLYTEGDSLYVWANNYTRVLQTAKNFLRGFLGVNATELGHVVSVTSKVYADAIGNSLAPSDQCPNFRDASGGDYYANWTAQYVAPIKARLQALITGNLTLTDNDVTQIPYLCGFESQITGRVSPYCNVFTDYELQQYQYGNDLRYYYGVGPGTPFPASMMLPWLNKIVQLLQAGPNRNGTAADGASEYNIPNLVVNFLNDGQLSELLTASGVHDSQEALSSSKMDPDRLYIGSRFITMKGQFAIERLNCAVKPLLNSTDLLPLNKRTSNCSATSTKNKKFAESTSNSTFVRLLLNDVVYPVPGCQNGPGYSCQLSDYVKFVANKYNTSGDWMSNCGVAAPGAPSVAKGATFYEDLSSDFLKIVSPNSN